MDDATVEILLQVRQRGEAAFAEASAGLQRVREALDRYRAAEAAGAGADEALRRALGTQMEAALEAGASFAALKNQTTDARQALQHYAEAVAAGIPPEEAQAAVLADLALQYQEVAASASDAAEAEDAVAVSSTGFAIPAFVGIALAVTAASAALSPFLILVGSAIVILTAFATAGAGMVALLGAIGLGIGGLGAGTLALGIAGLGGTSATTGAFARFKNDAGNALKELEKQAAPIASVILTWADKGIPAVEKLGSAILSWFGDRVPGILQQISRLLTDLTPDFTKFGEFLGAMFDRNESKIAPMAEQFIRFGLSIVTGLLTNLERLSDWFESRLPSFGPIVQQIMGAVGSAVQAVASTWGRFADFLVSNWPTITANARAAVASIGKAWQDASPQLKEVSDKILPLIPPLLDSIAKNSGALVPMIVGLASVFLILATAVLAVVAGIEQLVSWYNQASAAIGGLAKLATAPGAGNPAQLAHRSGGTQKIVVQVSPAPGTVAKALRPGYQV